MKPARLSVLVLVVCSLASPLVGPRAAAAQDAPSGPAAELPFRPHLAGGFHAVAHTGLWAGEVPARPEASEYLWGGGDRYVGGGFGVNADYHINRYLAAHFDITHYILSTPVAYAGGYSDGWWVESVSDFSVERVGPFDESVNYWRNATGIRLGLKGYFVRNGAIGAWAGAYLGYYAWKIENLSEDRAHTYGSSTGTAVAPSLVNVGIDFWNPDHTLGGTLYFETGSGLTGGYSMENCLVQGWTYNDGDGEHLIGPVRVGVSFNFTGAQK